MWTSASSREPNDGARKEKKKREKYLTQLKKESAAYASLRLWWETVRKNTWASDLTEVLTGERERERGSEEVAPEPPPAAAADGGGTRRDDEEMHHH